MGSEMAEPNFNDILKALNDASDKVLTSHTGATVEHFEKIAKQVETQINTIEKANNDAAKRMDKMLGGVDQNKVNELIEQAKDWNRLQQKEAELSKQQDQALTDRISKLKGQDPNAKPLTDKELQERVNRLKEGMSQTISQTEKTTQKSVKLQQAEQDYKLFKELYSLSDATAQAIKKAETPKQLEQVGKQAKEKLQQIKKQADARPTPEPNSKAAKAKQHTDSFIVTLAQQLDDMVVKAAKWAAKTTVKAVGGVVKKSLELGFKAIKASIKGVLNEFKPQKSLHEGKTKTVKADPHPVHEQSHSNKHAPEKAESQQQQKHFKK